MGHLDTPLKFQKHFELTTKDQNTVSPVLSAVHTTGVLRKAQPHDTNDERTEVHFCKDSHASALTTQTTITNERSANVSPLSTPIFATTVARAGAFVL
jgi:hypothetical protein